MNCRDSGICQSSLQTICNLQKQKKWGLGRPKYLISYLYTKKDTLIKSNTRAALTLMSPRGRREADMTSNPNESEIGTRLSKIKYKNIYERMKDLKKRHTAMQREWAEIMGKV